MLLIERGPGMRTKPIKTSYSSCAGTAYVIMEQMKVPVENLIGEENQGFKGETRQWSSASFCFVRKVSSFLSFHLQLNSC